MIRVEVQPYCDKCRVFEAEVEKPEVKCLRVYDPKECGYKEITDQTDTIIRCVRRRQCENIKRFLEQQSKGEKNND